jgi:hypothetical protein
MYMKTFQNLKEKKSETILVPTILTEEYSTYTQKTPLRAGVVVQGVRAPAQQA